MSLQQPELVQYPAFSVIGLSTRTSNHKEISGAESRIGALWGTFMSGGVDSIPGVVDQHAIFSVYTGYESDENGEYDVVLGRWVRNLDHVPKGLRGVSLPDAQYLVFPAEGATPPAIQAAWKFIWQYFAHSPEYRRVFTSDFERHVPGAADIYIAVR